MVGLLEVLRRTFGLTVAPTRPRFRSTADECGMREYSRHAGLRHRWIDHD
jgi:hypothetical protein